MFTGTNEKYSKKKNYQNSGYEKFAQKNLEDTISDPLTPPKHDKATQTGISQPTHSGNIFVATS